MADPGAAPSQLLRLLHIIPAATRSGGVSVRRLADELDVPEERVMADVRLLTDRAFYHTADHGAELQVLLEEDRLSIFSAGGFQRPVRLTGREALCVAVGLRRAGGDGARGGLRARLERELVLPGALPAGTGDAFATDAVAPDPAGHRAAVAEALRLRAPCRFGYLKEGSAAPEVREVEPWALLHAEGWWYLAGRDRDVGEPRVFRVDRMLGVRLGEGTVEVPHDVDPSSFLDGGRVFFRAHAGEDPPAARVRYSAAIARWVRERWPGGEDDGGGYVVRHPLLDPGWVVRHVLQYGADAELLEPAELRQVVAGTAARMAGD